MEYGISLYIELDLRGGGKLRARIFHIVLTLKQGKLSCQATQSHPKDHSRAIYESYKVPARKYQNNTMLDLL